MAIPQKIIAPFATEDRRFGSSLAIENDTAIITATGAVASSVYGEAYVYRFDGNVWNLTETIAAPANVWAGFGRSVDISGNRAIFGVVGDRSTNPEQSGSDIGSAYIYQFDGEQWNQEQRLGPIDPISFGRFGTDVAISGNAAIVTSNGNGLTEGSVSFYQFENNQWSLQQQVTEVQESSLNVENNAVQLDGNLATIYNQASNASQDLSATLNYYFDGATWQKLPALTQPEDFTQLNGPPSLLGNTLMIPVMEGSTATATSSTAVYVYVFNDNSWVLQQTLEGLFEPRLTTPNAATFVSDAGDTKVRVNYAFDGSTWTEQSRDTISGQITDALTTFSASDRNGSFTEAQGNTFAIADPYDDSAAKDAGAVYLYSPNDFEEQGYSGFVAFDDTPSNPALRYQTRLDLQALPENTPRTQGEAWQVQGIGDVNGDNEDDYFWRNTKTGQNSLWIINNDQVSRAVSLPSVAANWSVATIHDIDQDGHEDVIWFDQQSQQSVVWFMLNGNIARKVAVAPPANKPKFALEAIGDFDDNGSADFLWRDASTGQNLIQFMSGELQPWVESATNSLAGSDWTVISTDDTNADGKADILWQNAVSKEVKLWPMYAAQVLPPSTDSDAETVLTSLQRDRQFQQQTLLDDGLTLEPLEGRAGAKAIAINDNRVILGFDDTAYIYDLENGNLVRPQQITDFENDGRDEGFGGAVAISGDVAVVGGRYVDERFGPRPTLINSAAYIYRFDGQQWVAEQRLANPEDEQPVENEFFPNLISDGTTFGAAVAINPNNVLIGTEDIDDVVNEGNKVYPYQFDGARWNPLPSISSPGTDFGRTIVMENDRALIAGGSSNATVVSEYRLDGDQWSKVEELVAPDNASSQFGDSIALDGNTAIIGAPFNDGIGTLTGAAYIYTFDGNQWNLQQEISAPDLTEQGPLETFGSSVSIDGDTAIISSRQGGVISNLGSNDAIGSVFIYQFDGTRWVERSRITEPENAPLNHFGFSTAIQDDTVLLGYAGAPFSGENKLSGESTYILDLSEKSSDFNRDGYDDFLWQNLATGEIRIALSNQDVPFDIGTTISNTIDQSVWRLQTSGNLNNDSQPDLLWRNPFTGENQLWLMDRTQLQQVVPIDSLTGLSWQVEGIEDFNDDGQSDLFWYDAVSGETAVWLMDGTTVAQKTNINAQATPGFRIEGVGDFDGNGTQDLFWRNPDSGENLIWWMDGLNKINESLIQPLLGSSYYVGGIGDYDRSGTDDLTWRDASTGETFAWLINGTQVHSFGSLTSSYFADPSWRLVA